MQASNRYSYNNHVGAASLEKDKMQSSVLTLLTVAKCQIDSSHWEVEQWAKPFTASLGYFYLYFLRPTTEYVSRAYIYKIQISIHTVMYDLLLLK